ncbi:MAG: gamma-glutamyl-gamma-aminobutyrate hydrolase family protein [Actinomycetota bacterium]|nr:gamma-glutamyl-gamma-aminobutyrate hydrolase family protein [Actinomycetota bacterium]
MAMSSWAVMVRRNGAACSSLRGDVVPGGFGGRGFEGKVAALGACRRTRAPALGICLGMQAMAVEAARAGGLADATSEEVAADAEHRVVAVLCDQAGREGSGGSMRLGAYPAVLRTGSVAAGHYGATRCTERHRHRYEVDPAYLGYVGAGGLVVSGTSPDGRLVELLEDPAHPFYVGTQAHPELKSRPERPHPLFAGLLGAALARSAGHVRPAA